MESFDLMGNNNNYLTVKLKPKAEIKLACNSLLNLLGILPSFSEKAQKVFFFFGERLRKLINIG